MTNAETIDQDGVLREGVTLEELADYIQSADLMAEYLDFKLDPTVGKLLCCPWCGVTGGAFVFIDKYSGTFGFTFHCQFCGKNIGTTTVDRTKNDKAPVIDETLVMWNKIVKQAMAESL